MRSSPALQLQSILTKGRYSLQGQRETYREVCYTLLAHSRPPSLLLHLVVSTPSFVPSFLLSLRIFHCGIFSFRNSAATRRPVIHVEICPVVWRAFFSLLFTICNCSLWNLNPEGIGNFSFRYSLRRLNNEGKSLRSMVYIYIHKLFLCMFTTLIVVMCTSSDSHPLVLK
jgi:hypothetical protein